MVDRTRIGDGIDLIPAPLYPKHSRDEASWTCHCVVPVCCNQFHLRRSVLARLSLGSNNPNAALLWRNLLDNFLHRDPSLDAGYVLEDQCFRSQPPDCSDPVLDHSRNPLAVIFTSLPQHQKSATGYSFTFSLGSRQFIDILFHEYGLTFLKEENNDDKEIEMNTKTEGTIAILAALLVLLSPCGIRALQ